MNSRLYPKHDPIGVDAELRDHDGRSFARLSDTRERYFAQSSMSRDGHVAALPSAKDGAEIFARLFPLSAGAS